MNQTIQLHEICDAIWRFSIHRYIHALHLYSFALKSFISNSLTFLEEACLGKLLDLRKNPSKKSYFSSQVH